MSGTLKNTFLFYDCLVEIAMFYLFIPPTPFKRMHGTWLRRNEATVAVTATPDWNVSQ